MPVVRTDGRANGYVIKKISRMDGLPNFLKYGARLPRASPARGAPLKKYKNNTLKRKLKRWTLYELTS